MSTRDGGWELRHYGPELLILGPGRLEIMIDPFESQRVRWDFDPLAPALVGDLRQLGWELVLPDGVTLQGIMTWRPDFPGDVTQADYQVSVGNYILWTLPASFGAALWQTLRGKAPEN